MNLELNIDDLKIDIIRMLNNADKTPFYKKVGTRMLSAIADNFETEGAYFQRGTTWMPLAPSTIAARIRNNDIPINLLRIKGARAGLSGSFTAKANSTGVEIGTNIFYAKYLHFGTWKMPPRPLFPEYELPPDILEDIVILYENFVNRIFDK